MTDCTRVDALLIGGGVASASAAAELRARGFDGSILLVTRELDAPYHRPPVSKALLTGDCERSELLVRAPEWWEQQGIELRTRAPVVSLDVDRRVAVLASKQEIGFQQALLATGAMVRRLPLDGVHLQGIHFLRAPGNAVTLRDDVSDADRVVVVGGSFIGAEVAASLTALGKQCTVVMQEAHPLERAFGPQVGQFVGGLLESHGIKLRAERDVLAFHGDDRVHEVQLRSGERIAADAVVIGAGVVPDVMLAQRAGLSLGASGGVACDGELRTSAPAVFAAGDMCEFESPLHGRAVRIEHEEHAIAQGRTVARNMLGDGVRHEEPPYFWCDLADWATLESVGVIDDFDDETVTGDIASGTFTVWRLRDGRLRGAIAVGRPDDVRRARELCVEGAASSWQ